MNKGGLIEAVAKDLKISKAMSEKAVNSVLGTIKAGTKRGVNLIGFGSFGVGKRAARTGRNPQTGAALKIKACKVVRFKAGKAFKDSIQ
jgi:DNA-binding protein HU-beta